MAVILFLKGQKGSKHVNGLAYSPSVPLYLPFAQAGRHVGQLSCSLWAQGHTFPLVGLMLRTQTLAFQLHKVVGRQSLTEHATVKQLKSNYCSKYANIVSTHRMCALALSLQERKREAERGSHTSAMV